MYLATDPDREGEAISWHLAEALKIPEDEVKRITFNEVTKNAVRNSIKEARGIDMNLVDAQQARRILDRMIGYRISPLLWDKVKRGLSAGRVQSVALRIICDREEEINAFVPQEYWSLDADFSVKGMKKPFRAKFYGDENGKLAISSEEEANKILKAVAKAKFTVSEIKMGERKRQPAPPFTTSTLQQEAAKALNFSTQKTMRLAQQLYEGVDVKGHGTVGLITYLRTDSIRVSEEADAAAKQFVSDNYGKDFVIETEQKKADKKKIQDAHEAIRPTYVELTPAAVKESLSRDLFRLYQLIWKRFIASRMQAAKYETASVKISGGGYRFTATTSELVFDGFMAVYCPEEEEDTDEIKGGFLKSLTKDSELKAEEFFPARHFTSPPAHYNEASLVKTLEELGIGRPSTYAPTITTILARRYVVKENKNLYVTEIGEAVNRIMRQAFCSIVDVSFTANMETLLDAVESGDIHWKTIVRNFYPDLEESLANAEQELENIEIEDEVSDVTCEVCGRQMVIKYGPHGKFLACPGFPECRNTKPYLEKIGVPCPVCGKEVVVRKTKKGRRYYGCEANPECDFMAWQKPSGKKCPQCDGILLEKGNKLACASEECGYVEMSEK